jgi:hypothetical protein
MQPKPGLQQSSGGKRSIRKPVAGASMDKPPPAPEAPKAAIAR